MTPFIQTYQPKQLHAMQPYQDGLIPMIQTLLHANQLQLLLVGDIGVGKTTLVRAIVREYMGDDNHNILYINSLQE